MHHRRGVIGNCTRFGSSGRNDFFRSATGYVASQNGEKDSVPVRKRIFPAARGAQGVQVVIPRRLGEVIKQPTISRVLASKSGNGCTLRSSALAIVTQELWRP